MATFSKKLLHFLTLLFILLVLKFKSTESTFQKQNSTHVSNNESGGLDKREVTMQKNMPRITYEITKFKAKDFINIAPEHKSDIVYTVINKNVYDDICWSEFDDTDGEMLDWECGLLYGITALSLMFQMDSLSAIESLQTSPMTNNTIIDLMSNHGSLIHSLVLLVKANTRAEEESICYCERTNEFLAEYLTETLKVAGPESQTFSSSVKLGLEYNEDLIDCCSTKPFDLLRIVNFAVLRLEISPLTQIFSYGLLSELLDHIVPKHRKFVRSLNSNCTIYTRVIFKEDVFTTEMNERFKTLIAKYIIAWSEENKGDEIFIIQSYPLDINIPSNLDFLRKHVSPVFYGRYTPGKLPLISDKCQQGSLPCTNKYATTLMSQTFQNIVFSSHPWDTFCSILSKCPLDADHNLNTSSASNTSVVFTIYQETNEEYQMFTRKLAEQANNLNLRTIYFFHQYSSWNTSAWNTTVSLLHSKNVSIGCYVFFFKDIYLNSTSFIDDIKERCGPLLNVATNVLCEWHVNAALEGILPKFLVLLDHALQLLPKHLPNKKLIPALTLEGDSVSDKISSAQRILQNSGREILPIYCNSNEKRLNEFYNGVLTFAGIHSWDNLHLRSALSDGTNAGWWHNIETDNSKINRSNTDFPVLVHTNAVKQLLKDEQMPMTFPCIVWTEKSLEFGIPFLENDYCGTTIDMTLKKDVILTKGELETLLLFAFGKFSSVEMIVSSTLDLDTVREVLTEMFWDTLRRNNRTLIYMEMPLTLASEAIRLNHLSDEIVIHFSAWENYDPTSLNTVTENYKMPIGLSVVDCGYEINLNLSRLTELSFVSKLNYMICNAEPVLPNNFNRAWMQKYLNTMYYIKRYMESFLPRYVMMKGSFEVYFRLNFAQEPNCQGNTKQSVEAFLRFLTDVNQHSIGYKIKYFIVKAFEYQKDNYACSKSWWRLKSYNDLTNTSSYVDREEEHFGRPTKLTLQLPAVDFQRAEMSNNIVVVVIISVVSVFLIGAVIVMWISLQRMRKRYLTEKEINAFYNGEIEENGDINQDIDSSQWLGMPFPKNYEIPKSSIEIGKLIGSGEFGEVFIGMLNKETEVAIKVPKPNESKEIIKGALTEIKVLCHVGNGQHTNVILFLGAYTREMVRGKIFIVTEYCKNGSLQSYLRKRQGQCNDARTDAVVNLYELYKFAHEIALGMEYISGQQVVHGDLAARNVFLDADFICKIGDFGLSRKLYEYTEYVKKSQEPLPWRWMAIESLKNMEFTTKSDVWSYGVILWEIFSLGVLPYPGLAWNTTFVNDLESGMRMERAQLSTDPIYEKILSCWILQANERPTFIEMVEFFAEQRRNEYTML